MASAFPAAPSFAGNAAYQENVAALEHAYNTTLAGDQQTLKDDWMNASYQRTLMGKGEVLAEQSNEHKANAGGILESGINAGRRANIQTGYANKRAAITNKVGEAEGKIKLGEQRAHEETEGKINKEITNATEKQKAELEKGEAREPEATAALGPHPGAEQTVKNIFPGGQKEQAAYGKAQSHYATPAQQAEANAQKRREEAVLKQKKGK